METEASLAAAARFTDRHAHSAQRFYKVAGATIGGGIVKQRNEGSPTPDRHMWSAGSTYWLEAGLDVRYGQLDVKDSSDAATLIARRLQYLLSKRTALYFAADRMDDDGASALTIDGGVVAVQIRRRASGRPARWSVCGTPSEASPATGRP